MKNRIKAWGIFGTAFAAGILVSVYRSLPALVVLLLSELIFILAAPCCRRYENVWGFVLFCGTMIPVHLIWVSALIGLDLYMFSMEDIYEFLLMGFFLLAAFHAELIASQFIIALMRRKQVVIRE